MQYILPTTKGGRTTGPQFANPDIWEPIKLARLADLRQEKGTVFRATESALLFFTVLPTGL